MNFGYRLLIGGLVCAGVVGACWSLLAKKAGVNVTPEIVAQEATATHGKGDHAMFGGTPARNFVNMVAVGMSHEFPKSPDDDKVRVFGDRLKWKSQLGSRAYGGPTVANGKIVVGTNNDNPRNKRDRGKATDDDPDGPPLDKGVLMCFDEKTGAFLWQAIHDKLESGQVNDWPREGICATPLIEGNFVYYTSNRCEVVCVDLNGFADGNQGDQTEKYKDKTDADIIWKYDMMKEIKVFPHNMTATSPVAVGDLLFITTANGVDENHLNIPFPEAPSFICLNKKTGKLLWKSDLPGKAIMHGQWANATCATIKGKNLVIFPGGDGWLYAFAQETGKLVWKFDANPKDSKYELGGKGTRSDFIGTPVVYQDRVYIGTGQDPEHFEGIGHFWCIDATKEGDISPDLVTDASKDPPTTKTNPNSGVVWHYGGDEKRPFAKRDYTFGRTMSTACIIDDVIYISELAGYVHCLDAKTGKKYWQFDTKSAIWGSCYYVDGKVLLANEDGDMYIFKHDKNQTEMDEVTAGSQAAVAAEKKAKADGKDDSDAKKAGRDAYDEAAIKVRDAVKAKVLLQKVEVGETVRSTPIIANDTLYVMSEKHLFALKLK